jgi:hypothetical protein
MLAHKLEKSGTGRPVLSQLAQAQNPISDLRAASNEDGICIRYLRGPVDGRRPNLQTRTRRGVNPG